MALEPRWSVSDLAEHKKVSAALLYVRAKKTPFPPPALQGRSNFNTTRVFNRSHTRYLRSELLAWFEVVDGIKTIKRIA